MARRRPIQPAPTEPSDTVPAWAERRGSEYVKQYLSRQEERRRGRIADLIDRVPPVVAAEGAEAVRTWAEEWEARDPRLVPPDDDPRAPLQLPTPR